MGRVFQLPPLATVPASDALRSHLLALWRLLRLPPLAINRRERARVVAGAALGVAGVALLAPWWPPQVGLPWLMAPLGASTVLVFALPASPLAQPWAVVGGNTLSALAGLLAAACVPSPVLAAAAAVAGAIALMIATRSLHPPGGAVALLAVVAGLHDWHYAIDPVALDSLLLVLAGWAYNSLTGRRYPHPQGLTAPAAPSPTTRAWDFSDEDLSLVLSHYNQIVDLPRDDLRGLLVEAEQVAVQRRLQALRCGDIMTPNPRTVGYATPLDEAWRTLRQAGVKALPVVDRFDFVVGIVTQADFLRHAGLAAADDAPAGLDQRLRQLLKPTPGMHAEKPEAVGQIMTRQVRVTSAERPLADLLPLFSHEGHHHLPVLGPDRKLVGIITQTDVVAALARG